MIPKVFLFLTIIAGWPTPDVPTCTLESPTTANGIFCANPALKTATDITIQLDFPSMEECQSNAKAFLKASKVKKAECRSSGNWAP